MLEWVTSRSGLPVPRRGGQLLGSTLDPLVEAKKWVEKHGTIDGCEVLFILGIGSGYGIKYLLENFPSIDIVLIEHDYQVVETVFEKLSINIHDVTVVSDLDSESFKNNVFIKAAIHSVFKILKNSISIRLNEPQYKSVIEILSGRMKEGFLYHVNSRSKFRDSLDVNEVFKQSEASPISILDLERAVRKKGAPYNDGARIIFALRELIK